MQELLRIDQAKENLNKKKREDPESALILAPLEESDTKRGNFSIVEDNCEYSSDGLI